MNEKDIKQFYADKIKLQLENFVKGSSCEMSDGEMLEFLIALNNKLDKLLYLMGY